MDDLKKQLDALVETCAKFSSFLTKTCKHPTDDPCLTGLERMINEEKFICNTQTPNELNKKLLKKLEHRKRSYEEHLNEINTSREDLTLLSIYDLIKLVHQIPMVKIQLHAIRKYQECLLESNQRDGETSKTCL